MNGFHNVQPITLEKVVAGILEKIMFQLKMHMKQRLL